eukprot:gene53659-13118_t
MRGLKVEKRWEPGMGCPPHDLDEAPANIAAELVDAGVEQKAKRHVAMRLGVLSGQTPDERQVDVDLMWVTLLAVWARDFCRARNPNAGMGDKERDLEARVLALGYDAICKVASVDKQAWTLDDYWVTYYKYRSNVFRDR